MVEQVEIPLHLSQVLEEELENLPAPPPDRESERHVYAPAVEEEEGAPADPKRPAGARVRDRVKVKVAADWCFHEGHVKDAAALAAVLKQAAASWRVAREWNGASEEEREKTGPGEEKLKAAEPDEDELKAEPDLYTFLAFRYRGLWDWEHAPDCGAADIETLLNRILRDEDECGAPNAPDRTVFNGARLDRLRRRERTLRRETRALLKLTAGRGGADAFRGEAAARAAAGAEEADGRGQPFGATDLARFRRLLLEDAFPGELRRAYDLRLARVVGRLHAAGRSALCFSGGGIRSGTFALGVIQSLARRRLLDRFDYLSTVSGGGYIGGWLSAWIHRHPNGLQGVIKDLGGESRASNLEPEPEPLRHLRDYSNFITPKSGLLSADTWTFVVIYVRNLLLNWVVLLPLLASVLMVPRVVNAVVLADPAWRVLIGLAVFTGLSVFLLKPGWGTFWAAAGLCLLGLAVAAGAGYVERGQNHVPHILGAMLIAGTLLGGYVLAYMRLGRPSNSGAIRPGTFWDRHRDQSSFLWLGLLPLALAATLLTTFWVWFRHQTGTSASVTVNCVGWAWDASAWPVNSFSLFGRQFFEFGPRLKLLGWELVEFGPHFKIFGWQLAEFGPCLRLFGWEVGQFTAFLLYGLALGLTAWLLYGAFTAVSWAGATGEVERLYKRGSGARQRYAQAGKLYRHAARRGLVRTVFKGGVRELFVTVVASLIGAVLLYAAAVKIPVFYDPVVEPFYRVAARGVTAEGLYPYGDWYSAELYTLLAFPVYLFVFFLGITLFTGFTSRRTERPPTEEGHLRLPHVSARIRIEDEDREWLARASAWVFIAAAGWLFLGGLVIFGPLLFLWLGKWLAGVGGVSGLVSLLGGSSALTPGNKKEEARGGWLRVLGFNLVVVASFVFFCCIIIAVSLLAGTLVVWVASTFFPGGFPAWPEWLAAPAAAPAPRPDRFELFKDRYPFQSAENVFRGLHFPPWLYLLLVAFGLQLFGRLFGRFINLNKFSLHAGYRDRIIRAFLGASQRKAERQENPFTGFDPRDNLYMQELRPGLLREADFRQPHALGSFVAELNRPLDVLKRQAAELEKQAGETRAPGAGPSQPASEPERRAGAARARIALFLRERIRATEGESIRYFKDPPASIEFNPSFRAALFGDLNRIIQKDEIPDGGAGGGAPPPAPDEAALIRRNRARLKAAFDYIEDPPMPYRLMHVVNMALNLVGGDRLAWQQRRAESFTSTPLHSGSLFVGYRRTRQYGGKNGISLGTAVAISGAAASSNMGYFSPSVFVTFVLTFFNARLGWWLGNPGASGAGTYFRSHPSSALSPIIDEAFGLTDDDNPYVLLSDGGHFENLGLYEMVLRRCRNIVVVDGSADPGGTLEGLGDAVRKIRIDLGIRIEFKPPFPILPRPQSEERESGGYCAVGDIHYEDVDAEPPAKGEKAPTRSGHERHKLTGRIVYVKPTVYGGEPRDIFNYAKSHPDFPHESTADQFFDEPQFESHRMLGYYILEGLFEEALKSPGGEALRAGRDLQRFVDWLDRRAEEERRAAAGREDARPAPAPPDPELPYE